ncbi:MAG: UDP-glucuronic acid dehydrogenase [Gammaproteobacteria bacterium]|nr:UDP-glucuronic acid dehydrogenase [Gammaproteobacteria bacterium]
MKITILNSSENHPINAVLKSWIEKNLSNHQIQLVRSKNDLVGGDILFLISCTEVIDYYERAKFKKSLVIHASDLPMGRGWSPHIWEILNGAKHLIISLLEVEDKVDSGDIWKKVRINIPETALYEEINQLIFEKQLDLMDFAIENISQVVTYKQPTIKSSYWPKRKPKDSEIDIFKSIDQQFNLLRVSDDKRYPAFFYKNDKKFKIKLEPMNE